MSDFGDAFAGFAEGFMTEHARQLELERQDEKDEVRSRAKKFAEEKSVFDQNELADQQIMEKAEALTQSNSIIPNDAVVSIYQMFKGGLTAQQILNQVRTPGSKFDEIIPKPESNVAEQTDTLLANEKTEPLPAPDVKPKGSFLSDLFDKDKKALKSEERIKSKTLSTLGVDNDYYAEVLAGYIPKKRDANYTFTQGTETKDDNTLSFEKQAVIAAKKDPRWDTSSSTERVTILAEYKQSLSGEASKQTFETPKELAVFNLMNSPEYEALNNDPEKQNEMLVGLERMFDKEGTNSTLTEGTYRADLSKYTMMLTSDDEGERLEATNWFTKVKPAHDSAFLGLASLTREEGDPDVFAIIYQGDDGKPVFGTGSKVEGGGYQLSDDSIISADRINNVTTVDMSEARTKAVQAASTVYGNVSKAQIATSAAAQNLMSLDRIAFDNEAVLRTLEGGGSSLFSSFSKEVGGLVNLIGDLQENDPNQSSTSLLASINLEVDNMNISDETANAYKEFNAAVVRTIFATGKALGQSGNGFSNQDYNVISKSVVNANSYEAFSNNLRRLTNELYGTWNATAIDARNNALVQNVMMFPGGQEIVGNSILGVKEYYASDLGKQQASVYEWSQGKALSKKEATLIEKAGEEYLAMDMPKSLLGKKVILFMETRLEKQADGSTKTVATGTYSFEEY